jgi:type IV pilus assembly protein PilC
MSAAVSTFNYAVRDRTGKMITGTLDAESPAIVAAKLKQMGYAPVSIAEAGAGLKTELRIPGFGPKVKLKELALMTRQFATMLNSGLSLLRSLTILVDQTESKLLARTLVQVRNDIETGNSLSVSLAKHPRIFPPIMINMIKAGEIGGFLDSVLLQLAENFEQEVKLRSKVKSAMTYPLVVFFMAIVAVTVMLVFIIPVFAKLFKGLGGKLPTPTQILIDASASAKIVAPIVIVAAIVGASVYRRVKHKESVRAVVDPIKLKIPVFGGLFQKIALARFARNLGTMLHSGVPILQALDIVADTTGNIVIARAVRDVQDSVRTGEALSRPLEHHPIFPSMMVQMMSVGEDTGALDTMLAKVAQFCDEEVAATTESLTALLEPLMIAFLGGLVGSMIICLYLPLFDIYKLVGSG